MMLSFYSSLASLSKSKQAILSLIAPHSSAFDPNFLEQGLSTYLLMVPQFYDVESMQKNYGELVKLRSKHTTFQSVTVSPDLVELAESKTRGQSNS